MRKGPLRWEYKINDINFFSNLYFSTLKEAAARIILNHDRVVQQKPVTFR